MSKISNNPTVGIIMGSKSDWKGVMEHCSEIFKEFGINHDVRVISAHRTPKRLERFIKIIIMIQILTKIFGLKL